MRETPPHKLRRLPMPPEIATKVEACWEAGMSICATIDAVERAFETRLSFEQVHQRFISLSWRAAA